MAVQFIFGRSGTGKTSYCVDCVVRALKQGSAGQRLVFLVPEQASYQAERAVLSNKEILGYYSPYPFEPEASKKGLGLNILSFDRLQYLLLGRNTARPRLSRIGRQMVIRRILFEQKDKLKLFGRSASFAGFSRQMAETIGEIQSYAKEPEDVEQLVDELEKDEHNMFSALKFADLALILREYLKLVEGRFLDPDVQLKLARRAVAESGFFKGARIWIDGFSGFTGSELSILTELFKQAAEVHIALCLDPSAADLNSQPGNDFEKVGLFNPTGKTYSQLLQIVKGCKLELAEPVILRQAIRFRGCDVLSHIEADIFENEAEKLSAGGKVRVLSAPNMRAEVQFVARQIVEFVRHRDLRYRDIAVISPDLSRYEHYIRGYFKDYDIPFFIDSRQSLYHHQAVRFISFALRAVVGGFSSRDIFEYLKSGIVTIDSYDVDLLENYCLAFGIRGKDWTDGDRWSFDDKKEPFFDEGRVNEIRQRVILPLLEFRDKLLAAAGGSGKIGPAHFTRIVYEFLENMGLGQKINFWIEQAMETRDYAGADEHRQFYDGLLDIFDELGEAFEGVELSCDEYLSVIEDAFSQLTLALIPPRVDEVIIGSIERSRHPNLKAVFVIGATQKDFPVPIGYAGILTDEDRQAADTAGFEVGATTSKNLSQRQYLSYIAFTRPSEYLCISYPAVDEKGRALVRSQFIDDVESLFVDVAEEKISIPDSIGTAQEAFGQNEIDKIYTRSELSDFLCIRAGRDGEIESVLEKMCNDKELSGTGFFVKRAVQYDNDAELDRAVVEQLFSGRLESSATKLTAFANCPYKYFARYVLQLAERREFKFEPLDVGSFYHRVLDEVLKALKGKGQDFGTVSAERLKEVLQKAVAAIIEADGFIQGFCRHGRHNTFIIASACEVLQDCVLAVSQMVRAGRFRPILSEVSFGKRPDGLGDYKLQLGDGRAVYLSGRIDRIDVADIDGRKAAVVFDYKRRGASFGWSKFYHGLDMQLAIYMLAVSQSRNKEFKDCDIAGAFYIPVESAVKKGQLSESEEKKESFDYKAAGVFNGDYAFILDKEALKESRFYNFYVTKDGKPYGNYGSRGALRPEDFEKVLRYTEKKIVELAGAILAGNINIKPYKLGTASACSLCRYKSVCHFDWQINSYKFLEQRTKKDVLYEA